VFFSTVVANITTMNELLSLLSGKFFLFLFDRRSYKGQKKRGKRTNNDLQNNKQNTQDRPPWTPLKTGANLGAPDGKG